MIEFWIDAIFGGKQKKAIGWRNFPRRKEDKWKEVAAQAELCHDTVCAFAVVCILREFQNLPLAPFIIYMPPDNDTIRFLTIPTLKVWMVPKHYVKVEVIEEKWINLSHHIMFSIHSCLIMKKESTTTTYKYLFNRKKRASE